ncbi:unnamed protein product [Rotaria magnacalcarata]|uniref:Uncharacterized protein n=2 Tax=Rotaria magnacalcarata TaxID=392030 RepID=A0A819R167_9BILA|nr:unnamed protein product [Rotaria magnacalcarata]
MILFVLHGGYSILIGVIPKVTANTLALIMSDKFVLYHLRDINNPPAHLDDKQKSNWIRTAQKAQKNYQRQQQYSVFNLLTSFYEIIYVNKSTTTETMQKLIDHVQHCHEFTFDTKDDRSSMQLALIQIQKIPRQLPCFVVLLELFHLPSHDTLIFVKIRQLFQLIFQSKNKLYSSGPLQLELYSTVNYELFEWPITSQIFDIQRDFIIDLFQTSSSPSPSLSSSHHENNDIINTNINPQLFKNAVDHDLEFISEDSDDNITINQCRTIPVNTALYEQISDDEICINQLLRPMTTQPELEDISDDEQQQHQP